MRHPPQTQRAYALHETESHVNFVSYDNDFAKHHAKGYGLWCEVSLMVSTGVEPLSLILPCRSLRPCFGSPNSMPLSPHPRAACLPYLLCLRLPPSSAHLLLSCPALPAPLPAEQAPFLRRQSLQPKMQCRQLVSASRKMYKYQVYKQQTEVTSTSKQLQLTNTTSVFAKFLQTI